MITNERQYKITKAASRRLQEGLDAAKNREPSAGVHPRIHSAMQEGIRSQLDELDEQIAQYEKLRRGEVRVRVFTSLAGIALALIEARIAARLSQKELAKLLQVPEQQVQRYESTNYSGVSLERLQEIADVLQVGVEERVTYSVPLANTES
ncbi:MAG: helix-turn-helix transcriptional regulator [Acidimicrobiales bacterium]|jgi:HTH-type transcriptional regulator/antitoxin HigA